MYMDLAQNVTFVRLFVLCSFGLTFPLHLFSFRHKPQPVNPFQGGFK